MAPVTIDFHSHAFPDSLAGHAIETINANVPPGAEAVLDGTLDDLLRSMDRAGIERSVICSIATAPHQVRPILEWSLSIRGPRIIPFGSVHPDCAEPAAEVSRIAEVGLRGIKLHAMYQNFAVDDRRLWPLYGAVEGAGLVLLLHAGLDVAFPPDDDRAHPRRILAVHRAFPAMKMVAAHMGGWRMWGAVAGTLAGSGVYLETSYSFGQGRDGQVREVLRRHPVERVLFGTDSPWRDQAETLAAVRDELGGEEALARMLSWNAEGLLGLPPA